MSCRKNLIGECMEHGNSNVVNEAGFCRVGLVLQEQATRPKMTAEAATYVMQYLYGSKATAFCSGETCFVMVESPAGLALGGNTFEEAIEKCKVKYGPRPIIQEWVQRLGLRHQGVLVSAIRGCDVAPKENGSKALARFMRAAVLNAHCGDPTKAKSFIEVPTLESFKAAEDKFFHEWDALPLHYVMHLAHAAEIVGYHSGAENRYRTWAVCGGDAYQNVWLGFYMRVCMKLHVNPETKEQLDERLNKDEDSFGAEQQK